jgi:hypothetical protein
MRDKNICFVDSFVAPLIGCICNAECPTIRDGFVDKATGITQLVGDLAYRAPVRAQAANSGGIHGNTRPS